MIITDFVYSPLQKQGDIVGVPPAKLNLDIIFLGGFMNKAVFFLVSLMSLSASADVLVAGKAPAEILEGGKAPIDQVQLVERTIAATDGMLAQHYYDVVVSGMFGTFCGSPGYLVLETAAYSDAVQSFKLTQASHPIRCMMVSLPVRRTFVMTTVSPTRSGHAPTVKVNGIEASEQ